MAKPNPQAIVKNVFDLCHETGQEVKNKLLQTVCSVAEKKVYKQYTNPKTGKAIRSMSEWLSAVFPYGPELPGESEYSITLEDLKALAKSSKNRKAEAILAKCDADDKGGDASLYYNGAPSRPKAMQGTSRAYLLRRLEKEHPGIYQDFILAVNGSDDKPKYGSVRQAAIAAGIMKDTNPHDPLKRLKSNWKKASKKQRQEFRNWLRTNEAKQ